MIPRWHSYWIWIYHLNFIGSGNTFAVDGTTVDISIAGGGGGGGSASIGIGTTVGMRSLVSSLLVISGIILVKADYSSIIKM